MCWVIRCGQRSRLSFRADDWSHFVNCDLWPIDPLSTLVIVQVVTVGLPWGMIGFQSACPSYTRRKPVGIATLDDVARLIEWIFKTFRPADHTTGCKVYNIFIYIHFEAPALTSRGCGFKSWFHHAEIFAAATIQRHVKLLRRLVRVYTQCEVTSRNLRYDRYFVGRPIIWHNVGN